MMSGQIYRRSIIKKFFCIEVLWVWCGVGVIFRCRNIKKIKSSYSVAEIQSLTLFKIGLRNGKKENCPLHPCLISFFSPSSVFNVKTASFTLLHRSEMFELRRASKSYENLRDRLIIFFHSTAHLSGRRTPIAYYTR